MAEAKKDAVNSMEDLKNLTAGTASAPNKEAEKQETSTDKKEPKIDDLGRSYATGRRKESVGSCMVEKRVG